MTDVSWMEITVVLWLIVSLYYWYQKKKKEKEYADFLKWGCEKHG